MNYEVQYIECKEFKTISKDKDCEILINKYFGIKDPDTRNESGQNIILQINNDEIWDINFREFYVLNDKGQTVERFR